WHVVGRVLGEQGTPRDFRVCRQEQRPLAGEIAIGRGAGDAGLDGGLLDGGIHPVGQQAAGRVDQGLAGAGLLVAAAGRFIWYWHRHNGTVVPWDLSPILTREGPPMDPTEVSP